MTLSVWRIGTTKSLTLATLPFGSTLESGRWHRTAPDGQAVVYASSNRALCQLEKRVHCNGVQPRHQAMLRLELPDGAVLEDVRALGLPDNWRQYEAWTQDAGVQWRASGASLGLWVPSAVEPGELNLVLNPDHPHYAAIGVSVERNPFRFDSRMF